jgi:hypothetical protein
MICSSQDNNLEAGAPVGPCLLSQTKHCKDKTAEGGLKALIRKSRREIFYVNIENFRALVSAVGKYSPAGDMGYGGL